MAAFFLQFPGKRIAVFGNDENQNGGIKQKIPPTIMRTASEFGLSNPDYS